MMLYFLLLNIILSNKSLLAIYGIDINYTKKECKHRGIPMSAVFNLYICDDYLINPKQYEIVKENYKNCKIEKIDHYVCYCPKDYYGLKCDLLLIPKFNINYSIKQDEDCVKNSKNIDKYTNKLCNYYDKDEMYNVEINNNIYIDSELYKEGVKIQNEKVLITDIKENNQKKNFTYIKLNNWLDLSYKLDINYSLILLDINNLSPLTVINSSTITNNNNIYNILFKIKKADISKYFKYGRAYIKPFYSLNSTVYVVNKINWLEDNKYVVEYGNSFFNSIPYEKILLYLIIGIGIGYIFYKNIKSY